MKHFDIDELVSPVLLEKLSEDACWLLIPSSVQASLDMVRDDLGLPIFINGNGFINSGVRPLDCKIGAKRSTHKIKKTKMAFDLKCGDMKKLFALIKKNHKKYDIVRIENPKVTKSWCHAEFSFKKVNRDLIVFNP